MKGKLVNCLLILIVFCEFSSSSLLVTKTVKNPLEDVSLLIEDWNKKHSETNDVLVIGIEKSLSFLEKITKIVPKQNAVVVTSTSHCQLIEKRQGFVVIESEIFENVSFRSVLGKQ